MADCTALTTFPPGTCTSGQHGCDYAEPQCGLPLLCDGDIEVESFTSSENTCLLKCIGVPAKCMWFSFHKPDSRCYFFLTCDAPFESDGNYISGESRCPTSPGKNH